MPDQERRPNYLKSIHLDLEGRRLMMLAQDETVFQFSLTAQGIQYEILQAQPVTQRSVENLIEQQAPAKEKQPVTTLTGKIKGDVREGRPDGQGSPTAWSRLAAHLPGEEQAKMLSTTYHRGSTRIALNLHRDDQITAEGYLRPSTDPERMDGFSVFRILDYPGKPPKMAENP